MIRKRSNLYILINLWKMRWIINIIRWSKISKSHIFFILINTFYSFYFKIFTISSKATFVFPWGRGLPLIISTFILFLFPFLYYYFNHYLSHCTWLKTNITITKSNHNIIPFNQSNNIIISNNFSSNFTISPSKRTNT